MSPDAPGTYARDLADLDKITAKVNRLQAQLDDAKTEATAQIAKTLKSCIAEGHNRTEVLKHSPFSAPKVRAIGEDAGVPPDERYVRTLKGKPEV
jgi:hypothetical protein